MLDEQPLDAVGFITAPMELVSELVERYVGCVHDRKPMGQLVALVLSVLVERALTAQLTNQPSVQIGNCTLTLEEARARIEGLRGLPLF